MPQIPEKLRGALPWIASAATFSVFALLVVPGLVSPEREATDPSRHGLPPLLDRTDPLLPESVGLEGAPVTLVRVDESTSRLTGRWLEDEESKRSSARDLSRENLDCIIEPFQVVEIGTPVTGLIEKVHVDRSDRVARGQVLVQLEASVESAAVDLARARAGMVGQLQSREVRLGLGERKQERGNALYESKVLPADLRDEIDAEAQIARLELVQAREERELAALQLRQAQELLRRRTIASPIEGVVIDRLMSPGERVEEEPILRIAQIHPLRAEVILPSAMFGQVKVGMRAAITPEIPGDEVHVAKITVVDSVIDSASGTFGVRLELPNADHRIPGGLHCQASFLDQ